MEAVLVIKSGFSVPIQCTIKAKLNLRHFIQLGDNFIRAKGDTLTMASAQVFSWEAAEKGIDVHLQVGSNVLL